MSSDFSFFIELLEDHESRYSTAPYFIKDNDELVQSHLEGGYSEEYHDSEKYFETIAVSQKSSFIVSSHWQVNFEIIENVWIFRRTLTEFESEKYHHANNNLLYSSLRENILRLTPFQFENLIFEIFSEIEVYNYPIRRPYSRDGGYEFTVRYSDPITNSFDKICIQVKHEKVSLSVSHTRELIGVLDTIESRPAKYRSRGIIVSLQEPSEEARECAKNSSKSVDFISLERIIELMVGHQIGCKNVCKVPVLDRDYWSTIGGGLSCLN